MSGPSGSGKSTIIARLLETSELPLRLSVSATTRAPRPGEVDGKHYFFWTTERFEAAIRAEAFLEWARVHGRNYYGTLRQEVEPFRERGTGVILDIDVQGADQVRKLCPDAVAVFLKTSSPEIFEQRLRARGTEDEESIKRRLATAQRELERSGDYPFQVINDNLNTAVSDLQKIVRQAFKS
jgi:guanylate kinase